MRERYWWFVTGAGAALSTLAGTVLIGLGALRAVAGG